jgi:hypothetical protein
VTVANGTLYVTVDDGVLKFNLPMSAVGPAVSASGGP